MVERPYRYVPTVALCILADQYKKFVNSGDFKKQKDLDEINEELNIRFYTKKTDDRQISIEEYMRSRKNECNGQRTKNN